MYTSAADFHEPRIYRGSVRVWSNARDDASARLLEVVAVAGLIVDLFLGVF